MKVGTKYWRKATIAAVLAAMLLILSTAAVSAHNQNTGVYPIDSHPYGKSYGEWSAKWWQWAFQQKTFDNCPNESGPIWFLAAPTQSKCIVPANTAIMFPTFNTEWSVVEADVQGNQTPGQTCLVPTHPNGTSYAALLACTKAQANNATHSGAMLEADLDGKNLQSLTDYRAHSTPPPFKFTAISGNLFGVPPGDSHSVADGFWIILKPLSPGMHVLHFAATVYFPKVNPPATPFKFTTEANYCLIVQPSNQTCP